MKFTDDQIADIGEEIIRILKTVYDPEIPVDIYELGLIYDVQISDEADVKIIMTLTTPNCPVAETLPQEVKDKVKGYSDDFLATSEKNLIQLGKNAAVEKKGNTIIMFNYKQHRGTQSALFKIYACR